MRIETDFLVVGSGIAGLSFALKAAKHGHVAIICKTSSDEGATAWAQGGIAAVFSPEDSYDSHMNDTLSAGAGLCDEAIVEITVKEGPARVQELIDLGVSFTKNPDGQTFDLTREGGHHARRILHSHDFTGKTILQTLLAKAKAEPQIKFYENHVAIDLITDKSAKSSKSLRPKPQVKNLKDKSDRTRCLGVYALECPQGNSFAHGAIHTFAASVTVLASGGAGKVYLYTTNPDTATGDGISMAARAGARVANLEFMQFHPTCLYHPTAKSFLISEALRGEGAELINAKGEEFMKKHHEMGSLAPRDIVARAIDLEMKRSGSECVYLDMSRVAKKLGPEAVKQRFPSIYEKCLSFGIDLTRAPIPVVPAAHYHCGGVLTNEWGETSIHHLFAIGEVACTGLHGANRLASNSLLEGVVFAHRAAERLKQKIPQMKTPLSAVPLPEWDAGLAMPMEERIDIHHTWKEIRTLMWDYVGIVRTGRRLEKAKERLELIGHEINEYYWNFLLNRELIELRNLVTLANLMVESAILRKESRGLHFTLDHPERDDEYFRRNTVL